LLHPKPSPAPFQELLSCASSLSLLSGKVLLTTHKNRRPLALNPTARVGCASCSCKQPSDTLQPTPHKIFLITDVSIYLSDSVFGT
jgi:hypothetical protein